MNDELKKLAISKFKKSRANRGANPGDISNSVVRNLLTTISEKLYGKITNEQIIETLDFFGWKCPYTGRTIDSSMKDIQIDHIVAQNKDECGLNVRGNMVFADAKANSLKKDMNVEDFFLIQNVKDNKRKNLETFWQGTSLEVRKRRLAKIKEWQELCGYDPKKIKRKVQPLVTQMYKDVQKEQEARIKQVIDKVESIPTIVTTPADSKKFKNELLKYKQAKIVLYDKDGNVVKTMDWDASKFKANSDVRHNITTKTFWKNRKKGDFIRVEVSIVKP